MSGEVVPPIPRTIVVAQKRAEDIVAGDIVRKPGGDWFRVRRVFISPNPGWCENVDLWYREGALVPAYSPKRLDLVDVQMEVSGG